LEDAAGPSAAAFAVIHVVTHFDELLLLCAATDKDPIATARQKIVRNGKTIPVLMRSVL
jgi:hypothetical protein